MMPLEKQNFEPADFAFLEETSLAALLHPEMEKREDNLTRLKDMRIVYIPQMEGYNILSQNFLSKERVTFPINYSVSRVAVHEGHVVLDLKGRKLPNARLDLCALPERYLQPVNPLEVEAVLIA